MINNIKCLSQNTLPLGGEGWPAADVAEGPKNRKSDRASLAGPCSSEQERVENMQINRHAVDTAGSPDVPVMDQAAFGQSEPLQLVAKNDLQAFAAAYAEWKL